MKHVKGILVLLGKERTGDSTSLRALNSSQVGSMLPTAWLSGDEKKNLSRGEKPEAEVEALDSLLV